MVPETSFHGQPLSEKGFHEAPGKALKDQKLRKNFKRAMNGLMQKRRVMFPDSGELETLRNLAGGIRRDAISRLPDLLEELETNCQQNGIQVHWAQTTEEANSIVMNRNHGYFRWCPRSTWRYWIQKGSIPPSAKPSVKRGGADRCQPMFCSFQGLPKPQTSNKPWSTGFTDRSS